MSEDKSISISTKVLRVLELIDKKDMEYSSLMNLYNNTTETKTISEVERELLTQKIESVIRRLYPKQADKLLGKEYNIGSGNKSYSAVVFLEEVYTSIQEDYDLKDNLHKNGVKVGGSMIGGRQYIAWYLPFKGKSDWGTSISYRQTTKETEPIIEVSRYLGSMNDNTTKEKEMTDFCARSDRSKAISHFRDCLDMVGCPRTK